MPDLLMVQLSADNIKHLYALHEAVYGKKCPPDYFHRKYDTAYTGAQYIGFMAMDHDTAVSYYGLIPMFMSLSKKPVLAAQACDLMTHPGYRHKGLFTQLVTYTLAYAKTQNIHFVVGFPNQNSYPNFIKHLGWTHTETMNRYEFKFRDTLAAKLARKFLKPTLQGDRTQLKSPLLDEGHDGVIYDPAFLNYKRYNPNGVVGESPCEAWLSQRRAVWIGMINNATAETLPGQIAHLQKQTQAASLTFMVSPGTQLDRDLSLTCQPQPGFDIILKNLSGVYSTEKLKFQFSDIDIF